MSESMEHGDTDLRQAYARLAKAYEVKEALLDALCEMMAAHQRVDPHSEATCSNCTKARAAIAKAEDKP